MGKIHRPTFHPQGAKTVPGILLSLTPTEPHPFRGLEWESSTLPWTGACSQGGPRSIGGSGSAFAAL